MAVKHTAKSTSVCYMNIFLYSKLLIWSSMSERNALYLSIKISINQNINQSKYLSIKISINQNIYQSKYLSIKISINQNKTRAHRYKIVLNKCRLDVRKNFYSQRIVKEWNCLPSNIVEAKDVITFEKLFDRLHGDSKFEFKQT